MQFLGPEERHNPRFREEHFEAHSNIINDKTVFYRVVKHARDNFLEGPRIDELYYKYSNRFNAMKYLRLAAVGYFIGTILFYTVYKITVYEHKWANNYGCDVPYYSKFKYSTTLQYWRAFYIHFYQYKLFYFIDEQVIDPLNDNVLSPKAFDVYNYKRLIRAIKYDKKRDNSFDFLTIGEDDIEEYDDFV